MVLGAAGVAVVAGAIVCVAALDARHATLGLTLALLVAPLIADPLPPIVPLLFREVATLLGAYLLWILVRDTQPLTAGPLLGGRAEAAFVAAAFVVAFGLAPAVGHDRGPIAALAAGIAVAVAALDLIVFSGDVFRLGAGAVLALLAATLVRVGLAGPPGPLEHLVIGSVLLVTVLAAAHLGREAFAARGDLTLRRAAHDRG